MDTRRIKISCEFIQLTEAATPVVMQIRPRQESPVTLLEESWTTNPSVNTHAYSDLYGNPCLRLTLPAGRSVFSYQAIAEVPDAVEDVDMSAPQLSADQLPDAD